MKGWGAYTLFVTLPNKTTHSVRRLPKCVPVSEVKARLEVEVGIPAHVYVVFFGAVQLNETDVIEFRAGVKNGVLLRACLAAEWEHLFALTEKEDSDGLVELCIHTQTERIVLENNEDVVETQDVVDGYCAATALFISAYNGYLKTVQKLIQAAGAAGADLAQMAVGARGRCSLHAAAAGDQVQVLEVLLDTGAHATLTDHDGCSASDVATAHGAYIAERFLRSHILRRKGMSQAMRSVSRKANHRPATAQPLMRTPPQGTNSSTHPDPPTIILTHSPRTLPFQSPQQKTESPRADVKPGNKISTSMVTVPTSNSESQKQRKMRVKSAPVKTTQQTDTQKHGSCVTRRPFVAFRSVPMEELRAETVEYVALASGHYPGHDQKRQDRHVLTQMALGNSSRVTEGEGPHAPCSSLNSSLEDLSKEDQPVPKAYVPPTTSTLPLDTSRVSTAYQWKPADGVHQTGQEKTVTWVDTTTTTMPQSKEPQRVSKQELMKEYTRPGGTRTARAQSARYYRSKYHEQAEEERYYQTIPRPRPASAGPRYRAWKTWLLQKYEEDAQKVLVEQKNAPRREQCTRAFNRWLKKKYKQLEEQSDSEDSDDYSDNEEENNKAFEKWLESKRDYFLKQKQQPGSPANGRNSKMSVFQIGCTDETPLRAVDFNSYMRVHHKWYAKKKQYENWKKRKGTASSQSEGSTKWTPEELAEIKRNLVLQGCTYEEWMGQKTRERRQARLHVTAFGETSPRKW